ncbi:MAG: DUF2262 domain-containing protein, partial [Chloroflexaceae bacterium]|nr:DUF2262 domain-containing protein [Chloroflexaceae bacterium]
PGGAGGGRGGGEEFWTLLFKLVAWRIGDGSLQTEPLRLSRKVTDEELRHMQTLLVPYAVVRVQARVGESAYGGYQGLLEQYMGADDADAELNDYAQQLQQPVTLDDPLLGTFTLDRRVDWFSAEVVWDGQPVRLNLSESASAQAALQTAHALWQDQRVWAQRIREYAVEQLLELKNDSWLDDDEEELTALAFLERMQLESITVHSDGTFDFWHDDGDLFWGHTIQISGNLAEGPTLADIPG